jgi:hypothetical protein
MQNEANAKRRRHPGRGSVDLRREQERRHHQQVLHPLVRPHRFEVGRHHVVSIIRATIMKASTRTTFRRRRPARYPLRP